MRAILCHPDTPILSTAAAVLAAFLVCGLLVPPLFGLFLAAAVVAGIALLALRFPTGFCAGWLLIAGMSLEMTVHDMIGDEAYQPVIAAIKGSGIGLALLCAVRFGPRLDLLSPVWAFLAMLVAGLTHGLYPGVTASDSLRSFIGSAAPFVFGFARVPRSWADAIVRAAKWCPPVALAAALPFAAAGIRPLFIDSGGARLQGLGHPAFLAFVCLPAIYACLIELYRLGRRGDLALLAINGLILVLTGARAPLFYAAAVTGLALATIRSTVFAAADRIALVLAMLTALPVLAVLAGSLDDIRLFNVAVNETANLSGRDLLWPLFQAAAEQSPWFGWGMGAGNAVIPAGGHVAQMLHTWAAHNEYLRIGVEGGTIGRTLLIALCAAWVIAHTHALSPPDRRILRLAFLALAGHALTDNVLISTPACVFFAFAAAVFARGRGGSACFVRAGPRLGGFGRPAVGPVCRAYRPGDAAPR